jgi:hypothetical protein
MADDVKTAREIAEAIKGQAAVSLGPWPRDLELFIFGAKDSWSCGLSPARQASDIEYREGVLQIARELQRQFVSRGESGRQLSLSDPRSH